MGGLAITVLVLALLGALASWAVGARAAGRSLPRGSVREPHRSAMVVLWPFMLRRLQQPGTADAAILNKAVVALIACLTFAAATVSLSTNLNRVSR